MNRYITGIDEITKQVIYVPEETGLPEDFIEIGDFHHPGNLDELGPAVNHVLFHHFRDLMYKRGRTDIQSFKFIDINYEFDFNIPIEWVSATANGVSETTSTTEIALVFSRDPVGLTIDDISIVGAKKLGIDSTGSTRVLRVSNLQVNDSQSIQISLNQIDGFHFTTVLQSVTVYNSDLVDHTPEEYSPELTPPILSSFNFLPQNEDGFTIVPTPLETSNIVFVSKSGNDSTGQVYSLSTLPGGTFENPIGILPFKTLQAALPYIRENETDYLMIDISEPIESTTSICPPKGKSVTERHVIAPYGSDEFFKVAQFDSLTGDPPIKLQKVDNVTNLGNIFITGLEMLNTRRDPYNENFQGWDYDVGGAVVGITCYDQQNHTGILIERTKVSFGRSNGFGASSVDTGANISDVIFRRSVVQNNYSTGTHSQGLGFTRTLGILLEDVILLENGYSSHPDAQENFAGYTQFNHNSYAIKCENFIYSKVISIAPSSMHTKWTSDNTVYPNVVYTKNIYQFDCLFLLGNIVSSFGGNDRAGGGPRFENFNYCGNISQYIGRDVTHGFFGWGITIEDNKNSSAKNNLFLQSGNNSLTNKFATSVSNWVENVQYLNNILNDSGPIVEYSDEPEEMIKEGNLEDIPLDLFVLGGVTIEDYCIEHGIGTTIDDFKNALRNQYITGYNPDLTIDKIKPWFKSKYKLRNPYIINDLGSTKTVKVNSTTTLLFDIVFNNLPFTYTWYLNDVEISGETTNKLLLENIQLAQSGDIYKCKAEILGKTFWSSNLTLSVTPQRNYLVFSDNFVDQTSNYFKMTDFTVSPNSKVRFKFNAKEVSTGSIHQRVLTSRQSGANKDGIQISKTGDYLFTLGLSVQNVYWNFEDINENIFDEHDHQISFIFGNINEPCYLIIDDSSPYPSNENRVGSHSQTLRYCIGSDDLESSIWDIELFDSNGVLQTMYSVSSGAINGNTENAEIGSGTLEIYATEENWVYK